MSARIAAHEQLSKQPLTGFIEACEHLDAELVSTIDSSIETVRRPSIVDGLDTPSESSNRMRFSIHEAEGIDHPGTAILYDATKFEAVRAA